MAQSIKGKVQKVVSKEPENGYSIPEKKTIIETVKDVIAEAVEPNTPPPLDKGFVYYNKTFNQTVSDSSDNFIETLKSSDENQIMNFYENNKILVWLGGGIIAFLILKSLKLI